jgi:two-component sensor histidine kinase
MLAAIALLGPGAFSAPLVERSFGVTDFLYREPRTGLAGYIVFSVLGIAAFVGVYRFFVDVPYRGVTGWLVRGGLGIWLVIAVNDIAGSLGAPILMYMLEYGFLAFLVGVFATVRQQHSDTVALVESQRAAIDEANRHLEDEVARRTEQLAEVADGLREKISEQRATAAELKTKNDERGVLIREIHHRSKNNLQLINSLLSLSLTHGAVHTLAEMVELQKNRINAMAAVHKQLYGSADLANIDVAEYVRTLAAQIESAHHIPGAEVEFSIFLESIDLSVERAIPLGLWANEVITDAL